MFNPWELVNDIGVTVTYSTLKNHCGLTDGKQIWIADDLTINAERCTLTHELLHIIYGHTTCHNPKEEAHVRRRTAQLLITFEDLIAAIPRSTSDHELAEMLGVTIEVLNDRYQQLTPEQRRLFARVA